MQEAATQSHQRSLSYSMTLLKMQSVAKKDPDGFQNCQRTTSLTTHFLSCFFHERGSGKCTEASSALKSRERCQENVGPVITPHGRADPAEDSSKDAVGLDEQRYDTNTSEFCFSTQNQQDKLTKYQSVLRSKLYGLVGSRR